MKQPPLFDLPPQPRVRLTRRDYRLLYRCVSFYFHSDPEDMPSGAEIETLFLAGEKCRHLSGKRKRHDASAH